MDTASKDWLISMANGDARQAIAMLDATMHLYGKINVENLTQTCNQNFCVTTRKERNITTPLAPLLKVCARVSRMLRFITCVG